MLSEGVRITEVSPHEIRIRKNKNNKKKPQSITLLVKALVSSYHKIEYIK